MKLLTLDDESRAAAKKQLREGTEAIRMSMVEEIRASRRYRSALEARGAELDFALAAQALENEKDLVRRIMDLDEAVIVLC